MNRKASLFVLLELSAFLIEQPRTLASIMENLGVSERGVYRYLSDLIDTGFCIETVKLPNTRIKTYQITDVSPILFTKIKEIHDKIH